MECLIINPALSLLMKHLVIGQRHKAPNFSAFHWSPHYDGPNGSLFISILLHNSEFQILNSEICTTNFGIRNCEVYIIWTSGNS